MQNLDTRGGGRIPYFLRSSQLFVSRQDYVIFSARKAENRNFCTINRYLNLLKSSEAQLNFSLFMHAANVGLMLMFAVVVVPAVFKVLSQKAAASYLRVLFPRLFLFGFVTSSTATISSFFNNQSHITLVSAVIAMGFLFNALTLSQQINRFRDKMTSGEAGAEKVFSRLHLLSVAIFVSQFAASLYVIISETYFT